MVNNLLVFHGSNLDLKSQIKQLEQEIQKQTDKKFVICFLKKSPSLKEELFKSAYNNFIKINIIPLFMLPGSHLQQDIPDIIQEFSKYYPNISINLNSYLASDQDFIKYMTKKII